MKQFKTHISCPVSVSLKVLEECAEVVKGFNSEVYYWERGTYYSDASLKNCDAFVLILPESRFKMKLSDLPIGCRKELKQARDLGKELFLGYRAADGHIKIYSLSIEPSRDFVSGVACTTGDFSKFVSMRSTFNKSLEYEGLVIRDGTTNNMKFKTRRVEVVFPPAFSVTSKCIPAEEFSKPLKPLIRESSKRILLLSQ